ncbi:hypothetical protein [Mycobacterium aquaticum]|uniref:hypothetical protein n=1 Tax=Mycobacterium aquaticum TaxID=1927124 RepID=UPI001151B0C3|nr:hypothetical protein [Mycobacterium aquaticum]
MASSSTSPSLFPNWPPEANEFRFHWSAAPGIDLDNGPAVALRAYVESYRLVGLTGGDTSVVYPGFGRATPDNAGEATKHGQLFQLQYVRPKTRAEAEKNGWTYVARQIYGYQPTHLLSLVPQGDGYRATVCLGLYSVFTSTDDPNKYLSTNTESASGPLRYADGVEIWRVELTDHDPRVGDAPGSPAVAQRGPLPGPTDDVFGRWFITGSSSGLWGLVGEAEDVDPAEVRQQCGEAMPDDVGARIAMSTGLHDSPPPHGDPIPGWPGKAQ